jgi:two-component sensor histidine kinase
VRAVSLNVVVFAAYAVTGWLGLRLPYYGEQVTLVWAPAAIALAAIQLAGPIVVPGISLAAFAVNFVVAPRQPALAAAIAVGNTLGPTITAMLLVRVYALRPQLDRVRDALAYLGVGVLGTSLITATVGALSLCAVGDTPWSDLSMAWSVWLGGDAAGLLIVGPLLLTWLSKPDPILAKPITVAEKTAMVLVVTLITTITLAYGERVVSLPYAFGLVCLWILLRVGPSGAAVAIAAVAISLVIGTALGVGPFVVQSARAGMLSLWLFVAAVGALSITASALVAERDSALHHQRRLLTELDHRVKNTLATVVALAERSGEGAVGIDDYRERFVSRIRAVARTHEGMARSDWHAMNVADVVAMTLAPFDGVAPRHLLASGDAATLAARKVAPLTMVLHELATNAVKYGAWSRPEGRVAVTWERRAAGATLCFTWQESGGPQVTAKPSRGYGLGLIEGLVGQELGGRAELDFAAAGLVCRFQIPLD